ncbi:hypothetical protein [Hymenobacter terricola]|uniref:hypothetical protein n=1 Tax=Hymenobacter terricola TaxID=2819236 RepID=UPI001B3016B3|nr:hypothetical protein [Hymenobacter terricola]
MTKAPSVKPLQFNRPQLRFILSKLASAVSLWSRATGKSTLIAWLIHLIVTKMPRSCWGIVGSTYGQILTRTLPSTIDALERLGYFKDVHYFIGRKPPAAWNWPEPFQRPVKYDHFIIFYTGAGFHLISQDGNGSSSRGLNLDGWIADEGLLLDRDKLGTDVIASNRGNKGVWPDTPLHHGRFIFSSMPWGDQGKWLLEDSAYYDRDGNPFSATRDAMIKLQLEFVDSRSMKTRLKLYEEILSLSAKLCFYPNPKKLKKEGKEVPRGLLYSEANIFDNLVNLGIPYLEEQRRELSDFVFLIEILNQRPKSVEAGFYPRLAAHHAEECPNLAYIEGLDFHLGKLKVQDSRMDGDCRSHLPIRGAVDWGSKISTLTTAQIHEDVREYRFLKGLYVKHPKLINDLADQYAKHYEHHIKREFHFIEDTEWGNARKPDADLTYNQQFAGRLGTHGWRVRHFNQGRIPSYQRRYQVAHELLGEEDPRQLKIRFNKVQCKDVLTALSLAPIRQDSRGEIAKDKSSEKKLTIPGQEATHFTDTVDLHFISIDQHVGRSQVNPHGLIMVTS